MVLIGLNLYVVIIMLCIELFMFVTSIGYKGKPMNNLFEFDLQTY